MFDCHKLTGQLREMHGPIRLLEDVVVTSSVLVDDKGEVQSKAYTINSVVLYEKRRCDERLVLSAKGNQPLRIIGYHSDIHVPR